MRFPLRSQGTRTRLPRKNNTTHTQVPSTPDPQQTTANQQQQCVVQLPTTVPMRYYPGKTERIFHHHQQRPIESTPGCTRKQALPIGISRIRCLMQHALQQRFDCALRGLAPVHKLIINLHYHSPPSSNPPRFQTDPIRRVNGWCWSVPTAHQIPPGMHTLRCTHHRLRASCA